MGVRLNLSLWFSYDFLCSTVYTKKLVSLVLSWKISQQISLVQCLIAFRSVCLFVTCFRHITHDIYSGKTNLDLNIQSTDWINTFYTFILCNFATEKTNLDLHIQIIDSINTFDLVVYQICKARSKIFSYVNCCQNATVMIEDNIKSDFFFLPSSDATFLFVH